MQVIRDPSGRYFLFASSHRRSYFFVCVCVYFFVYTSFSLTSHQNSVLFYKNLPTRCHLTFHWPPLSAWLAASCLPKYTCKENKQDKLVNKINIISIQISKHFSQICYNQIIKFLQLLSFYLALISLYIISTGGSLCLR